MNIASASADIEGRPGTTPRGSCLFVQNLDFLCNQNFLCKAGRLANLEAAPAPRAPLQQSDLRKG